MTNPSEVIRIPDNEFWRMNPQKGYTYAIEWTPKLGGWVRCKLDSMDNWHYVACQFCQFAESIASPMIDKQRKKREKK